MQEKTKSNVFVKAWNAIKLENGKEYLLAVQHLFAMFGATILVPLLTGMNVSVALVTAGLGTLLFHLVTKGKVPVFLGSSFMFISCVAMYTLGPDGIPTQEGVQTAQAGIIFAGLLYLVFALCAYFLGAERIKKVFPPVVTGPVIILIGLGLASTGINDASGANAAEGFGPTWLCWLIAAFTAAIVILFNVVKFKKNKVFKIFNIIPILVGIACGYLLCVILHFCGAIEMDFSGIVSAHWFNIPYVSKDVNGIRFFSLPSFKNWGAVLSIAIVAIVPFMEHIGDITTNGAVVGKDFFKDPGLHRTLLGDGAATILAGFFGGPCNTTYSENTGVLATTGNYNPKILRWTAVFAIFLGFFGKFGGFLQTIPVPVRGGIEIILYGMISAIGLRTLAASKVDMTKFRNIIVVALILVIGIGIVVNGGINITFSETVKMNLSGVFVATIVGIIANTVLPKIKNEVRNMGSEEDIAAAKIAYGEVDAPVETGETATGNAAEELAVCETAEAEMHVDAAPAEDAEESAKANIAEENAANPEVENDGKSETADDTTSDAQKAAPAKNKRRK